MNRPHASRPTPNRPGMQGSKRERRPMSWRQHAAPRPPTAIPTSTAEHHDSTITNPTNQHSQTTPHYAWANQGATNRHRNGRAGYINNIRLYDHRQQRDGTHANPANHEAAKTTVHKPHRSCSRDLTVNRPHARRPTSNKPGVHGSKQERRPTGWPRHDAPRLTTAIPTNKTEPRDCTITQPTNQD